MRGPSQLQEAGGSSPGFPTEIHTALFARPMGGEGGRGYDGDAVLSPNWPPLHSSVNTI